MIARRCLNVASYRPVRGLGQGQSASGEARGGGELGEIGTANCYPATSSISSLLFAPLHELCEGHQAENAQAQQYKNSDAVGRSWQIFWQSRCVHTQIVLLGTRGLIYRLLDARPLLSRRPWTVDKVRLTAERGRLMRAGQRSASLTRFLAGTCLNVIFRSPILVGQ